MSLLEIWGFRFQPIGGCRNIIVILVECVYERVAIIQRIVLDGFCSPLTVYRTYNTTLRLLGIAADYEAIVRPGETSRLEGKGTANK